LYSTNSSSRIEENAISSSFFGITLVIVLFLYDKFTTFLKECSRFPDLSNQKI
jgi:hypothetical protein